MSDDAPDDDAAALLRRAVDEADVAAATAAVEAFRRVADDPAGPPGRLLNLATARYVRFQLTGSPDDQDAVLDLLRDALADTPAGTPDRIDLLVAITAAALERFIARHSPADLDIAVDAGRAAVAAGPPDHADRVDILANLATALRNRFELTGEGADLAAAIEAGEAAVDGTARDDPGWPGTTFTLGAALHRRYERDRDPDDLHRAGRHLEWAVDAAPPGDPVRAMALSSLGLVLRSRYRLTGAPDDLAAAIDLGNQAVAALPGDDPDRARYQSNVDGTLLRQEDAVVAQFRDRAAAAVRLAATDPGQALRSIDGLLADAVDRPAPAASVAALGYNRAALLRAQGRAADAAAGYAAVVDRFAGHPDPMGRFWVGLALYNHVTLILDTDPDEVAADRVPVLVAALRDQVAALAHPGLERRLRIAARLETELLERHGPPATAAASRARLDALLRPVLDHLLAMQEGADPTLPPDDAAPRRPLPRAAVLRPLVEDLDDGLDVIRALADADESDWYELIRPYPGLLSLGALHLFAAARDGAVPGPTDDDDRDRIGRGLMALGSLIRYLYDRPDLFPVGAGPVETLHAAVDRSVSLADALAHARTPAVVGTLTSPYVHALAERGSMGLLGDGHWRQAFRWHQLLLAAAERLPNSTEGRAMVRMARFRWLFVARQVLVNLPDGRVLHSAVDAGERLLRAYAADPQTRPGHPAEVLFALAGLYLEPHINLYSGGGADAISLAGLRRWYDRLAENVLDPVEVPEGVGVGLPGVTESLDTGEEYLRRALDLAVPAQVGNMLSLRLNAYAIRAGLGTPADPAEVADVAARAVAAIDADRYPQLLAQALLVRSAAGAGPDPDPTIGGAIDRLLARPIAVIAEQAGAEAATGVLISAGQLLRTIDPARGRRLFAESRGYIGALGERERIQVLLVHQKLLVNHGDLEPGEPGTGQDPGAATTALLDRATAAGWPSDRAAAALVTLAGRGYHAAAADDAAAADAADADAADADAAADAAERAWSEVLASVPARYPDLVPGHGDALLFLAAGWHTQASARAHDRGDWAHALRTQAMACGGYLALSLPDAAMESLTLIARSVDEAAGVGLARPAAVALGPLLVPAENLVGPAATDVLQRIWSRVAGAEAEVAEPDAVALLGCLQLAKGARFVDALRADITVDVAADPAAAELLGAIARIDDEPGRDVDLDAITLVTPYAGQLDVVGGVSLTHQRENLERTFDAYVQRALTNPTPGMPRLLGVDGILDLLPPGTVLLWTGLTHTADGGRMLLTTIGRRGGPDRPGRLAIVQQRVLDADEASRRTEIRFGERVRMVDPLGLAAHRIRQAVLAEPGPVRPVARSDEAALADAVPTLFGPAADLLREEYAAGGRHLVIIPHGPLHFAPLHLLYLDGQPLAATWTVTYLPALAFLERLADPPRTGTAGTGTALAAVGLGFADGSLPPIPEAVDEARAVAAEFGTTALIDGAATRTAVLAALATTRRFHIATHGAHTVAAPAFQRLYLADGPLHAYELLPLDLHGLDLVTLSACETALGRFDAADNLRGVPANLLLRGAGAIVGTLWPVESRTSRDFFTTLYRELRAGRSRLDAFAAAQRLTRARHPQYRDWGAFYYTGDWR